ncbi:MAG: TonB-dependent receptor plug domain-containing protein [Bacteroidales bacterium]|nr:TonB-dependent receptor plug domain-containing protein [Bacteroidales bacterium]
MKYYLIIATALLVSFTAQAQTRALQGKLTAYNSFPVMNVEVSSKKAKATTMSDSLGNFSIVCQEKDVIMIKPKGFQPVNEKVSADTDTLKINLIFIDTKKNRELAVNSGYMTETNLNYAVANLQEENNDYCKYSDILSLLRALGSGITVSNGGVITIRGGNTSFSGMDQALIVVDGQPTTSIDWIQPCNVRSVNVLKGSDAAIYGSRAGNGVVVITTRN